jgi:hypothetical protein
MIDELASLGAKFSENLLDATNAFSLVIEDEARLAGIPQDVLQSARAAGERGPRRQGRRRNLPRGIGPIACAFRSFGPRGGVGAAAESVRRPAQRAPRTRSTSRGATSRSRAG